MSRIEVDQLTKMYYTIGEVAELFDVNTSLIRHWEKEFKAIKPKKNKKGNRMFSPKEIMKIDQIYNLVKLEGYTLDGAKAALKKGSTDSTEQESEFGDVVQKLEMVRSRLLEIRAQLVS